MKKAAILMIWASVFWGFGVIASVWSLLSFGPLTSTALRFGLAAVVSVAIAASRHKRHFFESWREGIIPGILLSGIVLFQTWGLKTTTATKSGFIIGLYVFLVPVWNYFFEGIKASPAHWAYVGLATFGSYLILGNPFTGDWTVGDWLTFLAMTVASWQIFWLSYRQKHRSHRLAAEIFNSWQLVWAIVPAIIGLAFVSEPVPTSFESLAVLGLLISAFGSTLLAFHLQVVSQAHLPSALASLLCLLESPIAAIFAAIFLKESLEISQAIGCVLILGAAAGALRAGTQN